MALWDRRSLGRQPVEELKLGSTSVWDVKYSDTKLGICNVYDGYNFDLNLKPSPTLSDLNFKSYKSHESICYAFEFVKENKILTSSFYDSTLHLI